MHATYGIPRHYSHSTYGASYQASMPLTAPKITNGLLKADKDVPAWLTRDCYELLGLFGKFLPEGGNRISLHVNRVDPEEERRKAAAKKNERYVKTTLGTTELRCDPDGQYSAHITFNLPYDADDKDTKIRGQANQVYIHELIGHVARQMQSLVRTGRMIPQEFQHAEMVQRNSAYHKGIQLTLAWLNSRTDKRAERRHDLIESYLRDLKTMVLQDAPENLNSDHPDAERILSALAWIEELTAKSRDLRDPVWQYKYRG